jgi:hypothetical protein
MDREARRKDGKAIIATDIAKGKLCYSNYEAHVDECM